MDTFTFHKCQEQRPDTPTFPEVPRVSRILIAAPNYIQYPRHYIQKIDWFFLRARERARVQWSFLTVDGLWRNPNPRSWVDAVVFAGWDVWISHRSPEHWTIHPSVRSRTVYGTECSAPWKNAANAFTRRYGFSRHTPSLFAIVPQRSGFKMSILYFPLILSPLYISNKIKL